MKVSTWMKLDFDETIFDEKKILMKLDFLMSARKTKGNSPSSRKRQEVQT